MNVIEIKPSPQEKSPHKKQNSIDKRLALALESSQLGFWFWDVPSNRINGNHIWAEMIGAKSIKEDLDLSIWLENIHPDQRESVTHSLHALKLGKKSSHDIHFNLRQSDGGYKAVNERASVTRRNKQGEIVEICGTLRCFNHPDQENGLRKMNFSEVSGIQRSERHNQEIALLNWLVEMLQLCSSTDEAFEVIASTLKRLFPMAGGLLAQPNAEPDQLQIVVQWGDPQNKPLFFADDCWALRRKFIHQVGDTNRQLLCKHILDPFPAASICIPMIVQEEIVGLFYLCHQTNPHFFDTTTMQLVQAIADSAAVAMDNINLRESLRQQSIRDPLTRLFNRRYMEETLDREIKRAERAGYPLALMLFDIDFFKQVNDVHGHQAGDSVLRDLGDMLISHTRADDVACRYGGEEFLTILPNTNRQAVLHKAEKLRNMIKQMEWHFNVQKPTHITVSLGVAVYPADGKTSAELLKIADAGLYRAKNEGRDRIISLGLD